MRCRKRILTGAMLALLPLLASTAANAQKQGGTLRIFHRDSPANMSIHEEGTISVVAPIMPIFNNLVLFNQHEKQNRLDNIVPDLADSWSWSEDGKDLTFKLHQGVKWHDGKPFTAADVKCTWDLLQNKAPEKLRLNAREAWWANLDNVTADNDYQATFHLKRPQPAFLAFLASGFTPVYPCHVSPAQMRQHPIGTGPFKFVEYKPNQSIKVAKNPDYWKKGLPYLDAIEWTIIPNRSTQMLAFVAGQFDMTFPYEVTAANMKDIKSQMPECDLRDRADQFRAEPADDAQAAFRQPGAAQGGGDDDRPQGLCRHPRRGQRRCRHRRAAGARRAMGDAEGNARDSCRATPPTSPNRAKKPARSCSRLATARTSTSRSRSPRATCRTIATPRR